MIRVLVLGAAAGGGFPQWNSNSNACRRARLKDRAAQPATQASIAVTSDSKHWFIINASPDLREQINQNPPLHPQEGLRSSPIGGVILTNADVDAIAGLLHLRERTPLAIYGHQRILDVLEQNPIFRVLAQDTVNRIPFEVDQTIHIATQDGEDSGLRVTPFAVPGKVALYMEDSSQGPTFGTREGDTLGLEVTNAESSTRLLYIANCAAVNEELSTRCLGADLVFFDGTLWQDDEMIVRGEGEKTGLRMGHISMSGPKGSIAAFEGLKVGRKVFIHINNTNPALLSDSEERQTIENSGWEVAFDGMQIVLP